MGLAVLVSAASEDWLPASDTGEPAKARHLPLGASERHRELLPA